MDRIYYKLESTIMDTLNFFKNVWRFRKPLTHHTWWDNQTSLEFLQVSLTHMADNIEKYGIEIDESRLKKVNKMRRATELIQNYIESSYIEIAESELGELMLHDWDFEETGETIDNPMGEKNEKLYKLVDKDTPEERKHNKKVFERAREIEEQEWDELFKILKGQDYKEYRELYDAQTEKEKKERELWNEWFDGSGIKGWWD